MEHVEGLGIDDQENGYVCRTEDVPHDKGIKGLECIHLSSMEDLVASFKERGADCSYGDFEMTCKMPVKEWATHISDF